MYRILYGTLILTLLLNLLMKSLANCKALCIESLESLNRAYFDYKIDGGLPYVSFKLNNQNYSRILLVPITKESNDLDQINKFFKLDLLQNRLDNFSVSSMDCSFSYSNINKSDEIKSLSAINLFRAFDNLTSQVILNVAAIMHFRLSFNYIIEVSSFAFNGFENLIQLDLSKNRIAFIRPNAFYGLSKLKYLNLKSNSLSISFEPFSFSGLTDLEILEFPDVKMKILESYVFNNLTKIKNFAFDNYGLTEIEPFGLYGLESITQAYIGVGNMISKIYSHSFDGLRSCQSISMPNQDIEHIPSFTFNNLKQLVSIDLNGNPLKIIYSNAFYSLSKLFSIKMENIESIETIESYSFVGLDSIAERFYLKNNKLKVLNSYAFIGLKTSILDLSRNQISKLNGFCFYGLENLDILDLSSNKISVIEANIFSNLRSLRKISLDLNPIKAIESFGFSRLYSVINLDLSFMSFKILEKQSFNDLHSLESLSLTKNGLTNADYYFIGKNFYKIESIYLNNNNLVDIPCGSFESLINLRKLQLEYNLFKVIPSYCFSNLSNLTYLYLSHNQIEAIETKSFYKLSNLKELLLNGNPIYLIEEYSFRSLAKLQKLMILFSNIDHLSRYDLYGLENLKQLDLRQLNITGIESYVFETFKQLEAIDFNKCQVKMIKSWTFNNLKTVEDIDMFDNQIETIQSYAFNNLERLKFIDLRWNPIRRIELNAFNNLGSSVLIRFDRYFVSDPNDTEETFVEQFNEIKRVYRHFRLRKILHVDYYQSISVFNTKSIAINCQLTVRLLREYKILVYHIKDDKDYLNFIRKCGSSDLDLKKTEY